MEPVDLHRVQSYNMLQRYTRDILWYVSLYIVMVPQAWNPWNSSICTSHLRIGKHTAIQDVIQSQPRMVAHVPGEQT